MIRTLTALFVGLLISSAALCEDVWVNGYTRRDGTQVEGHYRSSPNAYNWDNKSYAPSQPAFNDSYYAPTKSYGSNWYQPSTTRYQDNNPYNDSYPSQYQTPKSNNYDWLNR